MTILSIETSCDDTCIAVVRASGPEGKPAASYGAGKKSPCFEIVSNVVSSQVEIHRKYGGVYPTLAKREHQRNLALVLEQGLLGAGLLKLKIKNQKSKLQCKIQNLEKILIREEILLRNLKSFLARHQKPKVDAIAVTVGPGLEPCLWVGVNFARALAYCWDLPIIPVNHIEAHIAANWLEPVGGISNFQFPIFNKFPISNFQFSKQLFPAVCLIVSGGHTQLILMTGIGDYKILGETRDDAAGECFDKTARILGLSYPGGPAIAAAAVIGVRHVSDTCLTPKLPRPMIRSKDYDFSFSGLKTAVLYDFKKQALKTRKSKKYVRAMAAEIQQAIIDVLIAKTLRAAKDYKVKTIILGGGVTANEELRKQLKEKIEQELPGTHYLTPNTSFCTDNAAMVAVAGYFNWLQGQTMDWQSVEAKANLRIGMKT